MSNYPIGAEYDSNAPYNTKLTTVTFSYNKTIKLEFEANHFLSEDEINEYMKSITDNFNEAIYGILEEYGTNIQIK